MKIIITMLFTILLLLSTSGAVNAGGIASWLADRTGIQELKKLDPLHREIKNAIPPYKQFEESVSKHVRHGTKEISRLVAGPVLSEAIKHSRNSARMHSHPIPLEIQGYLIEDGFNPYLVQNVRYRIGDNGVLNVANLSIHYGEASAVTLVDTIIFKPGIDIYNAYRLWVHEMVHVEQYHRWGLWDFSKRYAANYRDLESEAYGYENYIAAKWGLN